MQSRTYSGLMLFGIWIPGPETVAIREIRAAFVGSPKAFSPDNLPEAPRRHQLGPEG